MDNLNQNKMTFIANVLFVIFILFCLWFIVSSIIYRHKVSNNLDGSQSERQKKNEDYNMDYHP